LSGPSSAIVVGAGVGGLMCALALQRVGISSTVIERDAPPPTDIADSLAWQRGGVPQALHPHFFMGRLRLLLADRHADLLERLRSAGATESDLVDYVHPVARNRHRVRAGDVRLRTLNARRTTFESVIRRYVLEPRGIAIVADAKVTGLATRGASPVDVTGVRFERDGKLVEKSADFVVDASGRFGRLAEQLGIPMVIEQRDSGIWYFTRHYRLRAGSAFPPFSGLPAAVFPDFVVGALPADNGYFTVTFQISREDRDIAKALRRPEHFHAMCLQVAKMRPWVDSVVSEPVSDVFGFGQMDSFWRRTVVDGAPRVLNYFALGDNCVRSNPKYGRGCTWTTVAAHRLAEIVAATVDPGERIRRYEDALIDEFRADWESMEGADRASEAAFAIATGRRTGTFTERFAMRFEAFLNDACVLDSGVFREVWTSYHGLQTMKAWTHKPAMWLRLLASSIRRPWYASLFAHEHERPTRAELAHVASRG